jgi:hypothetical protein
VITVPLFDWRKTATVLPAGKTEPCVICHKPTMLLSPRGKPVHKVCAEQWTDRHPRSTSGGAA